MLSHYCGGDSQKEEEYSSLIFVIEGFDTVIDIWNHPLNKKFKRNPNEGLYECINSVDHSYIIYIDTFSTKSECKLGKK